MGPQRDDQERLEERWANTMLKAIRGGTGLSSRRIGREDNVEAAPTQFEVSRMIYSGQIWNREPSHFTGGQYDDRCFAAISLFTLYSPPLASAQLATTTSLVGNVTDPTGKSVQNAKVTAVETGTADTRTTTTNEQGYYSFEFARVGSVQHHGGASLAFRRSPRRASRSISTSPCEPTSPWQSAQSRSR